MDLAALAEADILAVIAECQQIGKEAFYQKHGSAESSPHLVIYERQHYDLSIIGSAAHQHATGNSPSTLTKDQVELQLKQHFKNIGFTILKRKTNKIGRTARTFGEIPGIEPGHEFSNRDDARILGIHCANQSGIVGDKTSGAESICVSGGYEDDKDLGWRIIYTGQGGQENGKQTSDQDFSISGNAALLTSSLTGQPVRVLRKIKKGTAADPINRYRYDGLFTVTSSWREPGLRGLMICRYTLDQFDPIPVDTPYSQDDLAQPPQGNSKPIRRAHTAQRIVRSTAVSAYVKAEYKHQCQICKNTLMIGLLPHSEGAHILPVGEPHNGPDEHDNILCLCPNCHIQFDKGAIIINDDLTIVKNGKPAGTLITKATCHPAFKYFEAHRRIHR